MLISLAPVVGPVIGGADNYFYSSRKLWGFGDVKLNHDGGGLFTTPREIMTNPQKPLGPLYRFDDIAPYPLASPQEQQYRSDLLRQRLKQAFSNRGK